MKPTSCRPVFCCLDAPLDPGERPTLSGNSTSDLITWMLATQKGEHSMSVEGFLRGKGKLDGTGARLAYEDRWMVFSGVANHWVVYQRKNNTQKTKVIYAGHPDGALEVLERGFATGSETVEDPKVCAAEIDGAPQLEGQFSGVGESNLWLLTNWFFCQPISSANVGR